jgi:hypothetical protein
MINPPFRSGIGLAGQDALKGLTIRWSDIKGGLHLQYAAFANILSPFDLLLGSSKDW